MKRKINERIAHIEVLGDFLFFSSILITKRRNAAKSSKNEEKKVGKLCSCSTLNRGISPKK
jgi:hypothetical protein